eukprot:6953441-Prymnesium_polylepis.3
MAALAETAEAREELGVASAKSALLATPTHGAKKPSVSSKKPWNAPPAAPAASPPTGLRMRTTSGSRTRSAACARKMRPWSGEQPWH